ncbi:MAG: bifunctional diaminohydroxyphosphoribosylaminopyrimidine deaminase/5-amino-6-(5-phosphoribosylamino)uracil reductase RibD [Phycisphaerae bacterium]|nr:bifunctional diaminohydroxyphosphoribosylaminopyrimidine deaminase/5-amino-6-(5-phosphoribosylamino)uracil reductase RibD [Phycisphaerae bacterium]
MAAADEQHMMRALALAARGVGAVEPNPPVGAVLVRDGAVLAEGWHERFGGPHAEAAALKAAREAGVDTRGATAYVTLEPCCDFPGKKTPPCADALIAAGVTRVVIAMTDPDAYVGGRGVARLRDAGVQVDVGVCERAAHELLAPYVTLRTTRRPWVICKWAQTADGYLARPGRRWVTGEAARRRVHDVRAICDGILVGIATALADDPSLTNRSGSGKQPARVVLDSRLRLPAGAKLVRTAREVPTVVVTTPKGAAQSQAHAETLRSASVEVMTVAESRDGVDLGALLDALGRRRWTRLLVEGGSGVLRSFTSGGLVDELQVFASPDAVGTQAGETLPRFDIADVPAAASVPSVVEQLGRDKLRHYVLRRP